jgi:poly(3-hydroxybutyrate) depolymerase
MTLTRRSLSLAALGLPMLAGTAWGRGAGLSEPVGDYLFDAWAGDPLRVFYAGPDTVGPDTPIVFVIHGVQRDADVYRDQWKDLARAGGFLVLCPQFDKAAFPKEADFSQGGVLDADGKPTPRDRWSFSAIEPMFDDIVSRLGSRQTHYRFYGHSGGSQFVHRCLFLTPKARASRVVMANAGWYTMPDPAQAWPYGLKGLPAGAADLAAAFARASTVLLGEADNDPNHRSLRHTPEADAQGMHRFARGHHFFRACQGRAKAMGVPFRWTLAYVPGADHQNRLMAPEAARLLAGQAPAHPGDATRSF